MSSVAGKVVNIRRLDDVITSINDWYNERGLFGMVSASSRISYLQLFIYILVIVCHDLDCNLFMLMDNYF